MRATIFGTLTLLGLLWINARSQTAPPDLSTPEKTIRSFLAALKVPDLPQALKCVAGAKPHPFIDRLQADIQRDKKNNIPQLNIADIQAQVTGDTATATVKYAAPVDRGMSPTETVKLRKEGEEWKIVPFDMTELMAAQRNASNQMPPVTLLSSVLANPNTLLAARDRARGVSCLSNVKQIALGTLMYVQDYDEILPRRGTSYKKLIMPYIKNEQIFTCPSDKPGTQSYTLNEQLLGVAETRIGKPAETVLIYEGKQGQLDFKHDGKASVAFADGHAKLIDATAAKAMRWAPSPAPPKAVKTNKRKKRTRKY
jgi:prepilin-type processing-associated H-X9-DG protein